ncbi:GspH/FimT family pseudopilin [Thioalkalivibrio thiocyanodenitrificans]|uniref:GspH/FimT family pseudopilin n=1 Tax=Thioalkalivibrio thiocyanodenitrificans TaxID=243063 RepID=UPI0003760F31|nr:GspH/FimT family pseudopilin [Thioalkalivibrio thiocyanodenitrificans]
MKKIRGFTLIELIVTMSVAAVLMTVAVPGFFNLVQNNQVTAQTNSLISSLNLARSEAVKRGVPVLVTAAEGGFSRGWCVHLPGECNEDNAIRVSYGFDRLEAHAGFAVLGFDERGARVLPSEALAATIMLHPAACAADTQRAREITVAVTGQIRVERKGC